MPRYNNPGQSKSSAKAKNVASNTMDSATDKFMRDISAHWRAIHAYLSAQGICAIDALEAAKAKRRGVHADAALASHLESALSRAQTQAAEDKRQAKEKRARASVPSLLS